MKLRSHFFTYTLVGLSISMATAYGSASRAEHSTGDCVQLKTNAQKLKKIEARLDVLNKMIQRSLGHTDQSSDAAKKIKQSLSKFEAESDQLLIQKKELTEQIQKCEPQTGPTDSMHAEFNSAYLDLPEKTFLTFFPQANFSNHRQWSRSQRLKKLDGQWTYFSEKGQIVSYLYFYSLQGEDITQANFENVLIASDELISEITNIYGNPTTAKSESIKYQEVKALQTNLVLRFAEWKLKNKIIKLELMNPGKIQSFVMSLHFYSRAASISENE